MSTALITRGWYNSSAGRYQSCDRQDFIHARAKTPRYPGTFWSAKCKEFMSISPWREGISKVIEPCLDGLHVATVEVYSPYNEPHNDKRCESHCV